MIVLKKGMNIWTHTD